MDAMKSAFSKYTRCELSPPPPLPVDRHSDKVSSGKPDRLFAKIRNDKLPLEDRLEAVTVLDGMIAAKELPLKKLLLFDGLTVLYEFFAHKVETLEGCSVMLNIIRTMLMVCGADVIPHVFKLKYIWPITGTLLKFQDKVHVRCTCCWALLKICNFACPVWNHPADVGASQKYPDFLMDVLLAILDNPIGGLGDLAPIVILAAQVGRHTTNLAVADATFLAGAAVPFFIAAWYQQTDFTLPDDKDLLSEDSAGTRNMKSVIGCAYYYIQEFLCFLCEKEEEVANILWTKPLTQLARYSLPQRESWLVTWLATIPGATGVPPVFVRDVLYMHLYLDHKIRRDAVDLYNMILWGISHKGDVPRVPEAHARAALCVMMTSVREDIKERGLFPQVFRELCFLAIRVSAAFFHDTLVELAAEVYNMIAPHASKLELDPGGDHIHHAMFILLRSSPKIMPYVVTQANTCALEAVIANLAKQKDFCVTLGGCVRIACLLCAYSAWCIPPEVTMGLSWEFLAGLYRRCVQATRIFHDPPDIDDLYYFSVLCNGLAVCMHHPGWLEYCEYDVIIKCITKVLLVAPLGGHFVEGIGILGMLMATGPTIHASTFADVIASAQRGLSMVHIDKVLAICFVILYPKCSVKCAHDVLTEPVFLARAKIAFRCLESRMGSLFFEIFTPGGGVVISFGEPGAPSLRDFAHKQLQTHLPFHKLGDTAHTKSTAGNEREEQSQPAPSGQTADEQRKPPLENSGDQQAHAPRVHECRIDSSLESRDSLAGDSIDAVSCEDLRHDKHLADKDGANVAAQSGEVRVIDASFLFNSAALSALDVLHAHTRDCAQAQQMGESSINVADLPPPGERCDVKRVEPRVGRVRTRMELVRGIRLRRAMKREARGRRSHGSLNYAEVRICPTSEVCV